MKKFTWILCGLMLCTVIAAGCGGGGGAKKDGDKKPAKTDKK